MFFKDLHDRGHQLSYISIWATDVKLKIFDETVYDNIVIFAPSGKFSAVSQEDLVQFTDEGGNILMGFSKESTEEMREFAEYYGVTVDKKGVEVIDHFESEESSDSR